MTAQIEASAGQGVAPAAGAVMSSWTDLTLTAPSVRARADADPLVTADMLSAAAASYLNGHEPRDPLASPLYGDLTGLAPIQLHVGTDEILLDDTRRYGARARAAGVEATVHVWEGMSYVFSSSIGTLVAAERALQAIGLFLSGRLAKQ
jgi:epsilon-lactone hydrolase